MREFSTPMMQQYMQIRQQHPESVLFFRLGDFYELFLEDALEGAKILGITLTRRPRGKDGDIPMAGVPFHSANTYINKLLRAGKKIAICEQVSEPDSKGIVERRVIRIITPGTVLDESSLEQKKHNFVVSIHIGEKIGLAAADVLTGEFSVCELERNGHDAEHIGSELLRLSPSEVVVSLQTYNTPELLKLVTSYYQSSVTYFQNWDEHAKHAAKNLAEHFAVPSVAVFGLSQMKETTIAAAELVAYVNHTQQTKVTHLNFPLVYSPHQSVLLDPATIANLEIFSTLHDQSAKGSLFAVLDKTQTAMGGRLLRTWINHPLKNSDALEERYAVIEELYAHGLERDAFQTQLQEIFDIQRLSSKLALGLGTAASILNIKQSLKIFLELQPKIILLKSSVAQTWKKLPSKEIKQIVADVEKTLVEKFETENEIGIIKEGVHAELDNLRKIFYSGKEWVAEFEAKERERTGIGSLKCRYNQVFGFYIEVSQSNLHLIPHDYIRKQTLVNAERFITPELKKQEELIVTAEVKIGQIERQLFQELVDRIITQLDCIKKVSYALAELDVFCSLAQLAQQERYVRPQLNTEGKIEIVAGKHPALASSLKENFVPNDVLLNNTNHQLLIITGPNMAGKSVFMRQVALLVLLAHIGSFIPAQSADIPIVDQIFVRSGASDNISRGLSTFMVEMVEAAHILHQATSNSLVIMDEIGRGTSTFDGISIAWAIAEYLVTTENKKPKVLFATHYHELQELAEKYPDSIKNFQVVVKEHKGKPIFLYTVAPGAASHSFGIAVAQLAGLPNSVLERATEMLASFESTHIQSSTKKSKKIERKENGVAHSTKLVQELLQFDVNSLRPIDALTTLEKLQNKAKKSGEYGSH